VRNRWSSLIHHGLSIPVGLHTYSYAPGPRQCALITASQIWNWRLDRVYFLAFLNPSRGQPDPALTARLASVASVGEPAIEFD
jgi:hypothetical protein